MFIRLNHQLLAYLDIEQEAHEALEEAPNDLGQLPHHARSLLSSLAQCDKELCGQLPCALFQCLCLRNLQESEASDTEVKGQKSTEECDPMTASSA